MKRGRRWLVSGVAFFCLMGMAHWAAVQVLQKTIRAAIAPLEMSWEGIHWSWTSGWGTRVDRWQIRVPGQDPLELRNVRFTFRPWGTLTGSRSWEMRVRDTQISKQGTALFFAQVPYFFPKGRAGLLQLDFLNGQELNASISIEPDAAMVGFGLDAFWASEALELAKDWNLRGPVIFQGSWKPLSSGFEWTGDLDCKGIEIRKNDIVFKPSSEPLRVQWASEWTPFLITFQQLSVVSRELDLHAQGSLLREGRRLDLQFFAKGIPAETLLSSLAPLDSVGKIEGGKISFSGQLAGVLDALQLKMDGRFEQIRWIPNGISAPGAWVLNGDWGWGNEGFVLRAANLNRPDQVPMTWVEKDPQNHSLSWKFQSPDQVITLGFDGGWLVRMDEIKKSWAAPQREKK